MENTAKINTFKRESNLELFRCITMLLIVAHHYVVNSGLRSDNSIVWLFPCSWRSLFIQIFGAWGKTGINCFVLITGYYMCKSDISAKKYFKLLSEIYFYRIVLTTIFVLTGYKKVTLRFLLRVLLPFTEINTNFTGCFILFYLFIPFLSILVKNITIKQHLYLIILCLFMYTFVGHFPRAVSMHYVSWFIVLFIIASFIRLHMQKYMMKRNSIYEWGGMVILITINILLICTIAYISLTVPLFQRKEYFFLGESSRLLPLLTGIIAFIVFKKLCIPYISLINIMGGSAFGVLLIHANSDTMRYWLWRDFLHNVEMYNSPWLVLHAIGSVLAIFIVCVAIDRLRIRFIEPQLMASFDKLYPSVLRGYNRFENWFARKTQFFIGD